MAGDARRRINRPARNRWAGAPPTGSAPYLYRELAEKAIAGVEITEHPDKVAVAFALRMAAAASEAQATKAGSPEIEPPSIYTFHSLLVPISGDGSFASEMALEEFTSRRPWGGQPSWRPMTDQSRQKRRLTLKNGKTRRDDVQKVDGDETGGGIVWLGRMRVERSLSIKPGGTIRHVNPSYWCLTTEGRRPPRKHHKRRGRPPEDGHAMTPAERAEAKVCRDKKIPFKLKAEPLVSLGRPLDLDWLQIEPPQKLQARALQALEARGLN
jgi:hypothetical protein